MAPEATYRVNSPKVILETFTDEVVIVNLDSGNYYSADKIGAEIWTLASSGATASEITQQISQLYEAPVQEIDQAIHAWVEQLRHENLIVPAQAEAGRRLPALESSPKPKQPFQLPVLQKYTDLQELLLLDPIHEVDESGWPNVSPVDAP